MSDHYLQFLLYEFIQRTDNSGLIGLTTSSPIRNRYNVLDHEDPWGDVNITYRMTVSNAVIAYRRFS